VTLIYDLSQLDRSDSGQAISELSYKTEIQRAILPLRGIPRGASVKRIKAALRQNPGVVATNINGVTRKAAVEYLSGQSSIEDLARTIEEAGDMTSQIDEDWIADQ